MLYLIGVCMQDLSESWKWMSAVICLYTGTVEQSRGRGAMTDIVRRPLEETGFRVSLQDPAVGQSSRPGCNGCCFCVCSEKRKLQVNVVTPIQCSMNGRKCTVVVEPKINQSQPDFIRTRSGYILAVPANWAVSKSVGTGSQSPIQPTNPEPTKGMKTFRSL